MSRVLLFPELYFARAALAYDIETCVRHDSSSAPGTAHDIHETIQQKQTLAMYVALQEQIQTLGKQYVAAWAPPIWMLGTCTHSAAEIIYQDEGKQYCAACKREAQEE